MKTLIDRYLELEKTISQLSRSIYAMEERGKLDSIDEVAVALIKLLYRNVNNDHHPLLLDLLEETGYRIVIYGTTTELKDKALCFFFPSIGNIVSSNRTGLNKRMMLQEWIGQTQLIINRKSFGPIEIIQRVRNKESWHYDLSGSDDLKKLSSILISNDVLENERWISLFIYEVGRVISTKAGEFLWYMEQTLQWSTELTLVIEAKIAAASKRIIAKVGNTYDNVHERGILYKRIGKSQEALADFEYCITIDPERLEALIHRCSILHEMERTEDSNEGYLELLKNKSVIWNPGAAWKIRLNYWNLLKHLGEYQDAIIQYRDALAINHDYGDLYSNLWDCYRKLGDLWKASLAYQKSLSLRNNVKDYKNLWDLYLQQWRLDSCARVLKRWLIHYPSASELRLRIWIVYFEKGQDDEALSSFEQAIQWISGTFVYYCIWKTMYFKWVSKKKHGHTKEAKKCFAKAIESLELSGVTGHPKWLAYAASAYREIGKHSEAVDCSRKALWFGVDGELWNLCNQIIVSTQND